ncbi:MAG TPA: cytidine deaminase [Afifellaceae bacterium]|nr:cytidine deaminase [Afifellaceae bacterium]
MMAGHADELFQAARKIRDLAYAPYSGFPVGVALRTEDGRIHIGCNVENASYPEGACAETGAISAMVAAGGGRIIELCIVADGEQLISPCGGCRQRIAEFGGPETIVHCADPDGIRGTFTLGELLPSAFALGGKS